MCVPRALATVTFGFRLLAPAPKGPKCFACRHECHRALIWWAAQPPRIRLESSEPIGTDGAICTQLRRPCQLLSMHADVPSQQTHRVGKIPTAGGGNSDR